MFGDIFHAITFGFFKKKDEQPAQPEKVVNPVSAPAPAPAPALVADAQVKAPGPALVADAQVKAPGLTAAPAAAALADLQSSSGGQGGGSRRRRRGSPKNRSKSKIGGSSMGFGRVGGKNKRSSRKKNTHKRRN
jgi:hypothetical protein